MTRLAVCFVLPFCGLFLGSCDRRLPSPASAHARYTLGPAWQSDGYWFYPVEDSSYRATGLAVVDARREAAPAVTADGERYDPQQVAAAHQTLQLPVMLRVRNLENGRQILVRVNDRGPASPGRVLSVTPHAAQLLGMDPRRATRVQLEEDESLSRGLLQHVDGAPPPEIIAAPVGPVREESLMPGGGSLPQTSSRPNHASAVQQNRTAAWLPCQGEGVITTGAAAPGRLWVDAGHFSQAVYARRLAAQLAGIMAQDGRGRSAIFSVRIGPFDLVREADAALDRARSAGVTGARIIVE